VTKQERFGSAGLWTRLIAEGTDRTQITFPGMRENEKIMRDNKKMDKEVPRVKEVQESQREGHTLFTEPPFIYSIFTIPIRMNTISFT
jgi:hypothetical protein